MGVSNYPFTTNIAYNSRRSI